MLLLFNTFAKMMWKEIGFCRIVGSSEQLKQRGVTMDILPLLDELQIIARNGLHYAQNPYDRERYERLMELTTRYYSEALDLPPAAVRERLSKELGYVTPKVRAD